MTTNPTKYIMETMVEHQKEIIVQSKSAIAQKKLSVQKMNHEIDELECIIEGSIGAIDELNKAISKQE